METVSLRALYPCEYAVEELFAVEQNWYSRQNGYSCYGLPKPSHTLLYLRDCSAVFQDLRGNSLSAGKGSVVYTPKGAEYSVRFSDTHQGAVDSIVVHFQWTDADGRPMALAEGICVCAVAGETLGERFEELCRVLRGPSVCPAEGKALLYGLLASIARLAYSQEAGDRLPALRRGALLLESDEELHRSVKEIARDCYMSECYFRRLFKRYYGVSPTEYRLGNRMERAKRLLAGEQRSVTAIALQLGFCDVYHFSRVFRRRIGVSPTEYQKSLRPERRG